MNSAKKFLNELEVETIMSAIATIALLLATLLSACAPTITPKPIQSHQASWDGNAQSSGLIGFDSVGNIVVTPHAVERYRLLADRYGYRFIPQVKPSDGISETSTNTFLLDAQHLVYFATMIRWQKEGK